MVDPANPGTVVSYPQGLEQYAPGPRGSRSEPDGNIWFTESGRRDREAEHVQPEHSHPELHPGLASLTPIRSGSHPVPGGNIWFTDAYNNAIGWINPSSPNSITEIPVRVPDRLQNFGSEIIAGPGASFTSPKSSPPSASITLAANQWSQVLLPSGQEPFGITVGPDNQSIWYTWEIPTSLGSGPQSSGIGTFNALAASFHQYSAEFHLFSSPRRQGV